MCEPTVKAATDRLALLALKVTVPKVVVPSLKVTVPLGETPLTVELNTVVPPNTVGLTLLAIDVTVAALVTVCARADDVLAALLVSPL